jgi:hypothetical protein
MTSSLTLIGTDPAAPWLLWAPLAAACAHIFEEFVWPGGFMNWYREYRGPAAGRITPRFLVLINAALLIGCWDAAAATDTPVRRAFWLAMCAVLAANGCWHLWAAARTRRYSPGVVTGGLLYIPLAAYGFATSIGSGRVSLRTAAISAVIGASYPIWSAVFHASGRGRQ